MSVDPAKLRIEVYPADILRQKADPVDPTPEVRAVAEKMIELMREAEGIGLAATQVGLPWQLFVCDVPPSEDRSADHDPPTATNGPVVHLNPELTAATGELEPLEEGCLSLPEIVGEVLRPPTVTMASTGLDGQRASWTASGLLARCWQHEIDHLRGVLILDRMTQMARLKNRSAVRSLEKRAGKR